MESKTSQTYLYSCWQSLLFLLLLNSATASDIESYTDPYDRLYLRIRSEAGDSYVYQDRSNNVAEMVNAPALEDLNSHWYIEASPDPNAYWIRNRATDAALHIESQVGLIEIDTLQPSFSSYRWRFQTDDGALRIQSAWQQDQYASKGVSLRHQPFDNESGNQRFVLEPLPHGATLPWTRYDESNVISVTAPGEIIRQNYDPTWDRSSPAVESQGGACILLNGFGTAATWTARDAANALTLRYSVPDGIVGTITLTVDPADGSPDWTSSIPLDSSQAWVYFDAGTEYDTSAPGRVPAKRFAEARVLLPNAIKSGDTLRLSRETGDELVWIDLFETEWTEPVTPGVESDYYNVRNAPWSAIADGTSDDTDAIKDCILAALNDGKKVYVPAGRYNLHEEIILPDGITLEGAGLWHTELFFSQAGSQSDGGLRGDGSNITLKNFYITGAQKTRESGYKGIKGLWGSGSVIDSVWVENTEVGMWIDDLVAPYDYTDGLIIKNSRIRNTFADGINLAGGTQNTIVENCHFRSTGDDALASWASGLDRGLGTTLRNRLRYNTIECGYRASGIGIFGGEGHRIHHNLVQDQYIGAGLRMNSVFLFLAGSSTQVGYGFGSNEPVRAYANTLQRTGARGLFGAELGAIDLVTGHDDVRNIEISDTQIKSTHFSGIRFNGAFVNASPTPFFNNITFRNIQIQNAPLGTRIGSSASGATTFEQVNLSPADTTAFLNGSTGFTIKQVASGVQITESGTGTDVSEAGQTDTYSVVLTTAPSSDVTIAISAGAQVSTQPTSLTFTPANWHTAQTITIFAIDDTIEESQHFGRIEHSVSSIDGRFTSEPLPVIEVSIEDNDQNQAPTIALDMPTRVALPSGVGLLLETNISDDGRPTNSSRSNIWSVIEKPDGSTVTFDDITAAHTGVQFDQTGDYVLQINVSDGELSDQATVTVHYGSPDGRMLLEGSDVGTVGLAGNIEEQDGIYTVRGSGSDVWNRSDEFYFFSAPFQGDGSMTIRLLSQTNTFEWAKVGLMIRDSLQPNASHALLATTPTNGMAFQNRLQTGDISFHNDVGNYTFPIWIRLERTGSIITGYRSEDGLSWTNVGSASPAMVNIDHIGIFLTSHNNGALGEATFDQLSEDALGLAPFVDAGKEETLAIGEGWQGGGSVRDDGLPKPAALTTTWQLRSGAPFDPNTLDSVPPSIGEYTLRRIGDDGLNRTFADVQLTVISQWKDWQISNFGSTSAAEAALEANPDGDALTNLLEYAFGSSPDNARDVALPSFRTTRDGNQTYFELQYRRLNSGNHGLNYTPQTTTNLNGTWQSSSANITEIGSPDDNGDGTSTVTLRLPITVGNAKQQFVRIKVELN